MGIIPDSASRFTRVVLLAVGTLLAGVAGEARGQMRVNSPTSGLGNITNIGQVGATSISRYFNSTYQASRGRAFSSPIAQRNNLSIFGRRLGRNRDLIGDVRTAAINQQVERSWLTRLSPGGAARYIRDTPRLRSSALGAGPGDSSNLGGQLMSAQSLLYSTSFVAPAYNAGIRGGIVRDPLSERDDSTEARYSVQSLSGDEHRSQADLMEARLAAKRERLIAEGWEWFRKGNEPENGEPLNGYLMAKSAFRRAEQLKRRDPEPRIGVFFCAVAQRQYSEAVQCMFSLLRCDRGRGVGHHCDLDQGIFGPEYSLANHYKSAGRMHRDVTEFVNFVNRRDIDPGLLAGVSFALWHAGSHAEALQVAQKLQQMDPNGAIGAYGLLMRRAEEEQAVDESG